MREQQDSNDPLESTASPSTLRPIQLFWKHTSLVCLGVAIGAVLGLLYYAQTKPVYQAGAQVLVVKKSPDATPLGADIRTQFADDYLSTHQAMIRSPLLVGEAVRIGKLQDLPSFANHGDPTGSIIGGLKTSREVRDAQPTNILNVTFRGPVPADCKLVVDAVIESYRKSLKGDYQNVSDETAKLIGDARDILFNKLATAKKNYGDFRLEHPTLWKSATGTSLIQERLQTIEAKRSALLVRYTEIEGRIALFKSALAMKRSREEMLAIVAQSSGRMAAELGKTAVEDPMQPLLLKEAMMAQEYGKDHPLLQAVRKEIEFRQRSLSNQAVGNDSNLSDPVQNHLSLLEREAEDARTAAEGLAGLLKKEQEEAKKGVSYENQDEAYRSEITRNEQLLDSISKRLDEVKLLKDFGGFIFQVLSPANNGGKVGPNPVPIFMVACLLGMVAGFGMAYLAELSDQSFRTPEEIRRQLGLPIMGHIPFFEKKDSDQQAVGTDGLFLNPSLCTVYRSKSREAEAYRVVRTSVFFSHRNQGHQIIQVTSPDVGDGKSTLASNLAVSIAQSGKSVLIIDADFRRPRAHKMFGLKPAQGLASVIMDQAELNDVIQASGVPGLSVLPCGPIPNNPAELLTQPRLKEVLELLREKFDFVIVDTPPLLAVTDPSIVVPHVDGVIMTVRISKNGRPHAKRAKEILVSLGANVLGVVVNGVGRDNEGYGYDKYAYGYTYRAYEYSDANYVDNGTHNQNGSHASTNEVQSQDKETRKTGRLFDWLFKR